MSKQPEVIKRAQIPGTPESATPTLDRSGAIEELRGALKKASAFIFSQVAGTAGAVEVNRCSVATASGNPSAYEEVTLLTWGNVTSNRWGLEFHVGIEDVPEQWRFVSLEQASADQLKMAAQALPVLLQELHNRRDSEVSEIAALTRDVLAFARGEGVGGKSGELPKWERNLRKHDQEAASAYEAYTAPKGGK